MLHSLELSGCVKECRCVRVWEGWWVRKVVAIDLVWEMRCGSVCERRGVAIWILEGKRGGRVLIKKGRRNTWHAPQKWVFPSLAIELVRNRGEGSSSATEARSPGLSLGRQVRNRGESFWSATKPAIQLGRQFFDSVASPLPAWFSADLFPNSILFSFHIQRTFSNLWNSSPTR